jgi:single-stranded DNA-binding protein
MARYNFAFVRGTIVHAPFFNRVPDRQRDGEIAFLKFHVRAPRDATQPSVFPYDAVRVVSYGELAERAYPRLRAGSRVYVVGWLQYRVSKKVLELVADEISTEDVQSLASQDVLRQLQQAASLLAVDVSVVLESILRPQLDAILQGARPLVIEQAGGNGGENGS